MTKFSKTAFSLIAIIAVFISVLVMTNEPANADAGYRSPELPARIIEADTLDLLTLNVAHGRGTAFNQMLVSAAGHRQNLKEIATILLDSNAQVAALQEADAPSLWSGKFDHVEFLAEVTGYPFFVHGYHADAWPFTYGAALISKYSMSNTSSQRFSPSWPTANKGFVRGTVLWRKTDKTVTPLPVTLVSVHLDFSREGVRQQQIAELVQALADVKTPLVILGDFNADWSTDDSPVRSLASELGLRPFMPAEQGLSTYKGTKRLDWILISDELTFVEYNVIPQVVSDHLAVVASIGWKEQK
jgi:endonuclease/exonuclease/phosphatase family metal-dependent hydrolase